MTVQDVQHAVQKIRDLSVSGDDEVAHGEEDDLRGSVLQAIADGLGDDARSLAKAALETKNIHFARWYA